ncbi:hypothetical protein D3C78_1488550 [compost metagenome]
MIALELVQPRQQQITAKVRGRRQLQDTADLILSTGEQAPPLIQLAQRRAGIFQESLALGRQAQAAGRSRQQPRPQLLLDTFQRRAGHCRRHVHAPRCR